MNLVIIYVAWTAIKIALIETLVKVSRESPRKLSCVILGNLNVIFRITGGA